MDYPFPISIDKNIPTIPLMHLCFDRYLRLLQQYAINNTNLVIKSGT